MTTIHYTDAVNAQLVIALLKAHGINQVVANPGTTNMDFVGSVQNDPYFKVWSAIDERHGSFLACGIAQESGRPVVLSCTGATASRNYYPGLTEAYYRKLPVLALTSSHAFSSVGQLTPQMLDRTERPKDLVRYSCQIPNVRSEGDRLVVERLINTALLELTRDGGGPVHVNLEHGANTFNTLELPSVTKISRIETWDNDWPEIAPNAKVAVFIGSHVRLTAVQESALALFLKNNNAVVLTDKTSSYHGYASVDGALVAAQGNKSIQADLKPDLTISIGEVSGDYYQLGFLGGAAPSWRVSPDGEVRSAFGRLENVFAMPEEVFFSHYAEKRTTNVSGTYARTWLELDHRLRSKIPALPFSNAWIALTLQDKIPSGSLVYLGILNSLRSWNFCAPQTGIETFSNVGGFGIDGGLSTLIGASFVSPDRMCMAVVGDLSFFYDMNSLGNRQISKNLRVLLINNGTGGEFNIYSHPASKMGEAVNDYIAAGRHFGNRSKTLVKHFAEDLGFKYLAASSTDEFASQQKVFLDVQSDMPILLECFTAPKDDSDAVYALCHIEPQQTTMKDELKSLIPCGMKTAMRKILK